MTSPGALKGLRPLLAALAAAGLAAGLLARFVGFGVWSETIWAAVAVPVLLTLLVEIVTSLRRGEVGLDIVAALSMSAALAVGQALAAAIVALMYAGGQYLESFAERRARRDMTALLSRVPRSALCYRDGRLDEVALESTHTIDIESFVPRDDVDEIYLDSPYYLAPDKRGAKGYALLREVLDRTGKVVALSRGQIDQQFMDAALDRAGVPR